MNSDRLKHFPISFFAVVLGLSGYTIALQKSEAMLHFPLIISHYLMMMTFMLTAVLILFYSAKSLKYFKEVQADFSHPVRMNFTPAIFITFLLASILTLEIHKDLSKVLWLIGVFGQSTIFLSTISKWTHNTNIEVHHFNPAWFIPAVGNILVPVAGVEHFNKEISWLFFSVGLVFWIVLLTIFYNRIFFHHPLPERLLPTLFLLIAPPAVGFISYVKLTGIIDAFAKILYYFALFNLIMLIFQFDTFKKINFYLSWWAYSFPITAFTVASILFYHKTGMIGYQYLAMTVLVLATLLILFLIYRTIIAIFINKEICVEE
ncbi:MAG: SLAC1 anion channel family protein [Candidatus Marinimicrobia bacterium]|nr:SLAC1 anion channel family protein [Candidatus Neomarinimicrobiota bacterium]